MGIKELGARAMKVEELIENLDTDTRAAFGNALRNMEYSVFEISAACRDDGYEIPPREIQGWRMRHMDELS